MESPAKARRLVMTDFVRHDGEGGRHREARSDVAIQLWRPMAARGWIASLRTQ